MRSDQYIIGPLDVKYIATTINNRGIISIKKRKIAKKISKILFILQLKNIKN